MWSGSSFRLIQFRTVPGDCQGVTGDLFPDGMVPHPNLSTIRLRSISWTCLLVFGGMVASTAKNCEWAPIGTLHQVIRIPGQVQQFLQAGGRIMDPAGIVGAGPPWGSVSGFPRTRGRIHPFCAKDVAFTDAVSKVSRFSPAFKMPIANGIAMAASPAAASTALRAKSSLSAARFFMIASMRFFKFAPVTPETHAIGDST